MRDSDVDPAPLSAWPTAAAAAHKTLWARGPAIDPSVYPGVDNTKRVLRSAFVAMSADADRPPHAQAAREQVLQTLVQM